MTCVIVADYHSEFGLPNNIGVGTGFADVRTELVRPLSFSIPQPVKSWYSVHSCLERCVDMFLALEVMGKGRSKVIGNSRRE